MKETKTFVATIRIDIRTFATVYLYFAEKGFQEVRYSRGKSISLAFKFFERLIVDAHPEYEFTSFSSALEFIKKEGVLDITQNFKNKMAVIKELQKESLTEEGIDTTDLFKSIIRKSHEKLPDGISSQQTLESIHSTLDKKIAGDSNPEIIVRKESLEEANERRKEKEQEEQDAFNNITKGD